MNALTLRTITPADFADVAELIHLSTNYWYAASGKPLIFTGDSANCIVFCETYEMLDAGCCIIAENEAGKIVGSCFYHPRKTHISVGIVNTHPNYFGKGVARQMLNRVIALAEQENLPVRLVSSAMNLDSFSLYTRAGFVPRQAFQDMFLPVPQSGLAMPAPSGHERVRPATKADIPALVQLERELTGLDRERDLQHFAANAQGIWQLLVIENPSGNALDGYLASVTHPASNLIGPGAVRTEAEVAALLFAHLNAQRGRSPVFLVPVECAALVQTCYAWGAKNCELHFLQVRGSVPNTSGILLPTFLPE